MNKVHKDALVRVVERIKNMPKHVFDEMLKEHENGDISYALNSAVDYEKKYNDLVASIKHRINYHTGGEEMKSMRESFRDDYVVSVLTDILDNNGVK